MSPETDHLDKINQFTLKPLTAEQVFIAKFLLAHNMIDRDRERFPEMLLDDFAKTLPGKSLLDGHNRGKLPIGLFFDSETEEMTPEQFTALTNEAANLPDYVPLVKVLWGWIYMVRSAMNTELTENIISGVYRHVSIGFKASDLITIKGPYDQVLFWEYVPPGEALEGSIVWLGAQPGATIQEGKMKGVTDKVETGIVDWRKKNPIVSDDE